jgi:hypothetical protein
VKKFTTNEGKLNLIINKQVLVNNNNRNKIKDNFQKIPNSNYNYNSNSNFLSTKVNKNLQQMIISFLNFCEVKEFSKTIKNKKMIEICDKVEKEYTISIYIYIIIF